ncbi:MAG: hypothetical protein J7623_02640 [Chitinophaga sp.]|uniref:hypothetical protein n=1 Tax=Chitinophaga sp. TaxID=1869181 RepID=UPI001B0D288B|nr:hypothetical protein [Chitinophaga sp.]MBO9727518.1 hypothetical protein [Chitinophaga sp.]
MLAYKSQTLDNLHIQEEAAKALRKDCIDVTTYRAIEAAHPVNFYTPNPVIKIGLFILTVVIVSFSLGLFSLMTLDIHHPERVIRGLCIFVGLGCYAVLELFIASKKLFRAGLDDGLLWCATGLLICSLATYEDTSTTTWCAITLVTTLLATLRFADMVMAGFAFLAFVGLAFSLLVEMGPVAKTIVPFVIMALSLVVYFMVRRGMRQHLLRHYNRCLTVAAVLALLTFYLAGNYFVVREVSNTMFDLQLQEGQSIPGAAFFWICTIIIPIAYGYLGIRKKDAILLRTGLVLLAAIVFTVRYYHHVMPLEAAMVAGGLILTVGAWALIRYLQTPRHGFTYMEADEPSLADKLKLESLIIAQTYVPGAPKPDMDFGGGSGGGGGASGNY